MKDREINKGTVAIIVVAVLVLAFVFSFVRGRMRVNKREVELTAESEYYAQVIPIRIGTEDYQPTYVIKSPEELQDFYNAYTWGRNNMDETGPDDLRNICGDAKYDEDFFKIQSIAVAMVTMPSVGDETVFISAVRDGTTVDLTYANYCPVEDPMSDIRLEKDEEGNALMIMEVDPEVEAVRLIEKPYPYE